MIQLDIQRLWDPPIVEDEFTKWVQKHDKHYSWAIIIPVKLLWKQFQNFTLKVEK